VWSHGRGQEQQKGEEREMKKRNNTRNNYKK
jgi:hypothetical protein